MRFRKEDLRFLGMVASMCLIFLGLLILHLPTISKAAETPELPSAWLGRICWDRYLDGDTVYCTVPGFNDPVRVRLAWVDAPELSQPWGQSAAELVRLLAGDERVTFWLVKRRGFYGRPLVAVILPDNQWLNHQLARYGLAWVACRANCPRARALADEAKAQGLGMWGDAAPQSPKAYRKTK